MSAISDNARAWLGGGDPSKLLGHARLWETNSPFGRGLRGYVWSLASREPGFPIDSDWGKVVAMARSYFLDGYQAPGLAGARPADLAATRSGVRHPSPLSSATLMTKTSRVPPRVMADLLRDSVRLHLGFEELSSIVRAYPFHLPWHHDLCGWRPDSFPREAVDLIGLLSAGRDSGRDPSAPAMALADLLERGGVEDADLLGHLRGREACPICAGGRLPQGFREDPGSAFCTGCHRSGGYRIPVCPGCTGEGCASCGHSGRVPYLHGPGCWAIDGLARWAGV